MTGHFCTYFDSAYLARGLALFDSLKRHVASDFVLHVLCLDDATRLALDTIEDTRLDAVTLTAVETFEPRLAEAKANRSLIEYYFTLTPVWPLYLLSAHPDVELLIFLDADVFCLGPMESVLAEIGDASIAITPHRFPAHARRREVYGKFNVGLIAYRHDDNALTCLSWFREQCLKWCYDRLEGDGFADQKYLDCWPETFDGVKVLDHRGINAGPWNIECFDLTLASGHVMLAHAEPLLLYHFNGLRRAPDGSLLTELSLAAQRDVVLLDAVYGPYVRLVDHLAAANGVTALANPRYAGQDALMLNTFPVQLEEKELEIVNLTTIASMLRAELDTKEAALHRLSADLLTKERALQDLASVAGELQDQLRHKRRALRRVGHSLALGLRKLAVLAKTP